MFVEVNGTTQDGTNVSRSWHLLAEGNDGPFIPCMALEALILRTLDEKTPAAGARPASNDLELEDYENLFARKTIFTGQRETVTTATSDDSRSIFRSILTSAFDKLPKPIRDLHDAEIELRMSGVATVKRGKGWLAGLIATAFQFPLEGNDVAVEVLIIKSASCETWRRTFAGRSFFSVLSRGLGNVEHLLIERFGSLEFAIALVVENDELQFIVRAWKFCGIPLPRSWAPGGRSYEFSKNGQFGFNIEIAHPLIGLIVNYAGTLRSSA